MGDEAKPGGGQDRLATIYGDSTNLSGPFKCIPKRRHDVDQLSTMKYLTKTVVVPDLDSRHERRDRVNWHRILPFDLRTATLKLPTAAEVPAHKALCAAGAHAARFSYFMVRKGKLLRELTVEPHMLP
ncbi:hypothetical protein EVAR_38556_1 [Eumeta japonica]|uniref:Uncharacterized protein n=1 Tax=Eumeta variegata TaxID=151549 RepID=A0A4C1WTS7_EUMVA|nr:hypothetical protein EVAR_38556_1 [Eumeta japonica]